MFKRWIPSRDAIRRSRWLAPIAHHLEDDRLWHMERGSVARGVAIGLFFGLLVPFAQFLLSIGAAILLRGHVAIAAAATLVSNPFTFAPLYWLAHRIGQAVLGEHVDEKAAEQVEAAVAHQGWLAATWETVQNAGAPVIVGLAVMAVVAAATGFVLVWVLWRPRPPAGGEPRT
ncbi:MAG TPA: DUF2062 domain-containing protein [Ideonella sp.]|nr:DUF2062 domain-containing protein [Ideonella sp.]